RTVKWNWGWAAAGATACLLIIASISLWQSWSAKTPTPSTQLVAEVKEPPVSGKTAPTAANSSSPVTARIAKPKIRETPVVRGAEAGPKLILLYPREGATVRLPLQTLRWLPMPNATFYEVKVVTQDGDAVAMESTNNPELQLAADALKP